MHKLSGYIVVFLGSGLGGALRHTVNVAAFRLLGSGFPYGTLSVNVVGSLVMGLLAGGLAYNTDMGQLWRLFLTTGIVGGFTTFSAFSLDVATLYERGAMGTTALYALASVGVSVTALFAGLLTVRHFA